MMKIQNYNLCEALKNYKEGTVLSVKSFHFIFMPVMIHETYRIIMS